MYLRDYQQSNDFWKFAWGWLINIEVIEHIYLLDVQFKYTLQSMQQTINMPANECTNFIMFYKSWHWSYSPF